MQTLPLSSRVIKTELIEWRDLQFIQQADFKEWVPDGKQKLQASLLRYQFVDPFKVWHHEGVMYCLDGKHRFDDLVKLAAEGHDVPALLPATFIDCRDMQEAAELVLIYTSRYAIITESGLFSFASQYKLDLPELIPVMGMPDFDLDKFMGDIGRDFGTRNQELVIESFTNEVVLKLTYTKDEYIAIKNRITELLSARGLTKAEDLFKALLFA